MRLRLLGRSHEARSGLRIVLNAKDLCGVCGLHAAEDEGADSLL